MTTERQLELSILYVEDDFIARKIMLEMLNSTFPEIRVHEASDAETALAMLPRINPHVVITDLGLHGMSGVDMARKMKESIPGLQIIVLSGSDPESQDETIMQHADHYLLKPVDYDTLVGILRKTARETSTRSGGP